MEVSEMIYEDELPEFMTYSDYSKWYNKSRIVDGVRMGPRVPKIAITDNRKEWREKLKEIHHLYAAERIFDAFFKLEKVRPKWYKPCSQ